MSASTCTHCHTLTPFNLAGFEGALEEINVIETKELESIRMNTV